MLHAPVFDKRESTSSRLEERKVNKMKGVACTCVWQNRINFFKIGGKKTEQIERCCMHLCMTKQDQLLRDWRKEN